MDNPRNIWVIGGDGRQGYLAQGLAQDGHWVSAFAMEEGHPMTGVTQRHTLEGVEDATHIILPLPVVAEGGLLSTPRSKKPHQITSVLDAFSSNQTLCGGLVSPMVAQLAQGRGLTIHDYYGREELAVANAIPTVEGALQLAMEELPVTLWGCNVLVVGYGRVGKLLAHRLQGLGAKVTVAARDFAQLTWCGVYGHQTLNIAQLEGGVGDFTLIFNTVPTPVLSEAVLKTLKPQCLLIELASPPYGVAFDVAQRLGIGVIWARSLPGKVAPMTAGVILKEVICNLFDELGV